MKGKDDKRGGWGMEDCRETWGWEEGREKGKRGSGCLAVSRPLTLRALSSLR